jgi:DNA (cytosine-5)-methyltransferase 1
MLLKQASLFSGIGGFDLAAEWMGWENVFNCEIESFPRKILNYYWPMVESFSDITKTDFRKYANKIDILTGGFPCQGFSIAGIRKGTEDNRFLWPEMHRAYQESKPTWVICENVTGILTMEDKREVSADVFFKVEGRRIVRLLEVDQYEAIYIRQEKMLIESICQDFEKDGYEVQPIVIPAASVEAPHKRDRIWIIAYNSNAGDESLQRERENRIYGSESITNSHDGNRQKKQFQTGREKYLDWIISKQSSSNTKSYNKQWDRICQKQQERQIGRSDSGTNKNGDASNSNCIGRIQNNIKQQTTKSKSTIPCWKRFPTQPPICSRNDGLSDRLDGITFPKWRSESIKAYGNAIVPQVAYEIFKIIEKQYNHHE